MPLPQARYCICSWEKSASPARLTNLLSSPNVGNGTGTVAGLARTGAMASLKGLGSPPPHAPNAAQRHYLGTDAQGRDVASRLLYGFRISIFFALFLTLSAQIVAGLVGPA